MTNAKHRNCVHVPPPSVTSIFWRDFCIPTVSINVLPTVIGKKKYGWKIADAQGLTAGLSKENLKTVRQLSKPGLLCSFVGFVVGEREAPKTNSVEGIHFPG